MTRKELELQASRVIDAVQALTLEAERVAEGMRNAARKVAEGVPLDAIGAHGTYTLAERAASVVRQEARFEAYAAVLADEGK